LLITVTPQTYETKAHIQGMSGSRQFAASEYDYKLGGCCGGAPHQVGALLHLADGRRINHAACALGQRHVDRHLLPTKWETSLCYYRSVSSACRPACRRAHSAQYLRQAPKKPCSLCPMWHAAGVCSQSLHSFAQGRRSPHHTAGGTASSSLTKSTPSCHYFQQRFAAEM
jgi:hypothetical protein